MRLLVVLLLLASPSGLFAEAKFETQEIDTGLKIGYAVITADVDGDKKPDIVVVDQHKVVWYQNPTWQKRVMLDGQTKPDNVTIAAMDLDGDGLPEFVIGAAWKPFDTKTPGTLQWIRRGKTLEDPWTMFAIPNDEPTIHRIRAIDLDGDGQPELVSVPLMGREATKEQNWADGRALRVTSYKIPAKPEVPANWKPVVLNEDLHVAHNFDALPKSRGMILASYEGISELTPKASGWDRVLRHEANQANPKSNRGASEIRVSAHGLIATIEPWHGSQVVVYTPEADKKLSRKAIDEELRWGHALAWSDVDGTGREALVVGVRDDHPTVKRGVRIYRQDIKNGSWQRELLDPNGVAVEDLTVSDLNSDGKPDIIAVGRATGNVRIYWNRR